MSAEPSSSGFSTTRWTLVRESRGDATSAKQALSDLCAAYYAPVVTFIARSGFEEGRARDLAHDFFARVLSSSQTLRADRGRGRFRSYLLGAVKHFVSDTLDRERAIKRGGGEKWEHLTETGMPLPDDSVPAPDRAFDRQWALTLLDRVLEQLASEFDASEKTTHFALLKPWLTGDDGDLSQAEIARRLGMNEGAVKVAIHRLRKRFREMVKAEIAQTTGETEVHDELNHLVSILASR
jgi:RNA polymerase sigma factor (sigma-70 family)